jgi:hypothetical protein
VEVKGAGEAGRGTRAGSDNGGKLEAAMDLEELAAVFEGIATAQGYLVKIEPADARGALVGMKGGGDDNASPSR